MVRPDRVELPTFWFVARRSIQLSYGRTRWMANSFNVPSPGPLCNHHPRTNPLAPGTLTIYLHRIASSRLLAVIVYHASAQDPFVLAAVAFTMVLTGSPSVAGP